MSGPGPKRLKIADHAEGANLRTDWRDCRRRHHLTARAPGRRQKLGLPLLLVARRHLYADGPDASRLLRRGTRLAGSALRAVAGSPRQVQIMYGVGGERWLPELALPWLPGYENSSPVRVGNAAYEQLQLDVYGEIAGAIFQAGKGLAPTKRGQALRPEIMEHLATAWQQPDEGIWEVRGGPQHFVHSKVMAWVAFDRAAKLLAREGLSDAARRWRWIAREIHAEVCRRGFDRQLNSFVQAYGSKHLDASLLLLPLVGFLQPADPRIKGTIQAIETGC